MTTTVYTAIFGGFDTLEPPACAGRTEVKDVLHVCFTDRPMWVSGWDVRLVERQARDPRREARMYKTLSHLWFPDADVTIWQDGNVRLTVHPDRLANTLEHPGVDMLALRHPERDCIYEEAKAVVHYGCATQGQVDEQIEVIAKSGYPPHNGLAETGLLVRRHNEAVRRFNETWWAWLTRYTLRGQLSFNYLCWQMEMEHATLAGKREDVAEWHGHKGVACG